jgi:anti-sigma factor ChrR (cupin superfamily)
VTDDAPDIDDLVLGTAPPGADPAACRQADEVLVTLARAPGPVAPPVGIRDRLLGQIAAEPFTRSAATGSWEPTPVPGLTRRVLFVDRPNNRVTCLLRLAPGGRLPAHPHTGVEEVFMLEGELHGPAWVLRPGDYQRSESGTQHVEQWSDAGCTALVAMPMTEDVGA